MVYKEELILLIKKDNNIDEALEKVLKKALRESKITGQSIESIIYELLEALENQNLNEKEFIKFIDLIFKLILEDVNNNIKNSYKNYIVSKKICRESINRELAIVEEFFETIKNYAKDSEHDNLKEYISSFNLLDLNKKISYNKLKN